MAKAIIELRNDVVNGKTDVLVILRKAHLIASKLELIEFDQWITNELNGYQNAKIVPSYREVVGTIKAHNPYIGWIPVIMPAKIEVALSKRKIINSIPEIVALCQSDSNQMLIKLPDDLSKKLCEDAGVMFPCYFVCGKHPLTDIIDHVKNTILEWCIKLEKKGIDGPDYEFAKNDINEAKSITETINFYGQTQTINGNISQSETAKNVVNLNYKEIKGMLNEIKKTIQNLHNVNNKEDSIKMIDDIGDAIKNKRNPNVIKSMLVGLKDFLISTGAGVAAAIISSKII